MARDAYGFVAHPRTIKEIAPASPVDRRLMGYHTTSASRRKEGPTSVSQKRAVNSLVLCCCATQGIVSPGLAALCQTDGTPLRGEVPIELLGDGKTIGSAQVDAQGIAAFDVERLQTNCGS